jgi:hypothetical protein
LTRRDLTRLLVKSFGLLVLLDTAVDLPSTVYRFFFQMSNWDAAGVAYNWLAASLLAVNYFGPVVVYVVIGLGLMWSSARIADRANQSPGEPDVPLASTDLKGIEITLVTVIGLYFLVDGVAELCRLVFSQGIKYGLSGPPTVMPFWRISWFELPWIMQALMKLAIGALLVLGRGTTVATLHQARYWVRKWRAYPYRPD